MLSEDKKEEISEFWYWWDKNVTQKPLWNLMGKAYGIILGGGAAGYVIASLLRGSWTSHLFNIAIIIAFLLITFNLTYSFINMEMSSKYWNKNWNFNRNK